MPARDGDTSLLLELVPRRAHSTNALEHVARRRIESTLFGDDEPVRLGPYHLVERLGAGGFSTVYLAYDPKLDRRLALKLLETSLAGADAWADTLREAQALAKLTSPNVVAVYDVGTYRARADAPPSPYIAMELVQGPSLWSWLHDAQRSQAEIVEAVRSAGRGLAAVHDAGLVHHDFKPSNVLRAADGTIKVCDFGLARLFATDDAAAPTSSFAGTPRYMAPEQLRGDPTDVRTDVYAFAVALWEALYRQAPFSGDDIDALERHRTADALIEVTQTCVARGVHDVLRRSLRSDPDARPSSMHEVLDALAPPPSPRSRWRGLAIGLALASATALVVWRPRALPSVTVAQIGPLEQAALHAASKALFVYPLPDDPHGPTAYQKVRQIEQLDLPQASERAKTLREEFAATLVRLGDRYWDADGGRAFSTDYYIQALMFVPDDRRASERAAISPGRLLALERKVQAHDISDAQLRAAMPLVMLAREDTHERARGVRALMADPELLAAVRADLGRLAEALPAGASAAVVDPVPETTVADEPIAVVLPTDEEATLDANEPADAIAIAQGRRLLQAGKLADAERSFRRALAEHPDDPHALAGLAEALFERGQYRKAYRAAVRAARLATRNGRIQLLAGDTAFKIHAYAQARTRYEAAQRLGVSEAGRRIATLDETLQASTAPPP